MSDENAVKTWWNQASVATASNQTSSSTSNQVNDDFVLDFWDDEEDIEESTNTVSDKDNNSASDWKDIKDPKWDEATSWLDNNEDPLNGDDLFGDDSEEKQEVKRNEDSKEKKDINNAETSKSNWKSIKDSEWDKKDTWLNDEDTFGGDDLFGDDPEWKNDVERRYKSWWNKW